MKKALIAMSGGVDSSVAAYLTIQAGYECMGATMKLHDFKDSATQENACGNPDDIEDARSIAARLNMPFQVFDLTGDFEEQVICRFVRAYEQGRTPNPCIDCNKYMKFDRLLERGRQLGYDIVVTGHYARVEQLSDGSFVLRKGLDETKDQSYVLYRLTQEQLAHIRFPLGGMTKTEAREIAEREGFANAHKHDSQDICFVPDGDYGAFLERFTGKTYPPGKFVDGEGRVLGEHKGIVRYTIGQRRGLGIAAAAPLYVNRIDVDKNMVVLGSNDELFTREVTAEDVNIISGRPLAGECRFTAKIRYRHKEQPAIVTQDESGRLHVLFDEPVRAVTAGQSLVLYDGDICIGGGIIV